MDRQDAIFLEQTLEIIKRQVSSLEEKIKNLENEGKKKQEKRFSPVIIRYCRYLNEDTDRIDAHGGVTLAFMIDYVNEVALAGISVCSKQENFSKKIGYKLAKKRLSNDPIVFPYKAPNDSSLCKAFFDHVAFDKTFGMTEENAKLIKTIDFARVIY